MDKIALYVSEKKLKQFAKEGFYELQKRGVTYQIHRKPQNFQAIKEIAQLRARIKELKNMNRLGA